jgi:two-component sensor histidine kinase
MTEDLKSLTELGLQAENIDLRRLLAQAGIDAIEHEVAERLQRLLLQELHHRVKNTLATVIAITSQSLRTAESLDHGRQTIESRLIALGRAHDLLLQSNWASAKFTDVIRAAIEPYDTQGAQRFVVQGANIEVGSGAVLTFAMALNELCTNAVKYGALSSAEGHVEITSALDEGAQRFKLTWAEKGGPSVKEPTRRSFGTYLIEHTLARQLRGEARLRFDPAGVICEFDIPLAHLRALKSQ